MQNRIHLKLSCLSLLCGLLCGPWLYSCSAPEPNGDAATEGALAMVNGVSITEHDVGHWLANRRAGSESELTPEQRRNVLEAIIKKEILRQRSIELGIHGDEGFQEQLRKRQAKLAAFERSELARLFLAREVMAKAEISEQEARSYFDQHAAQLRTQYHIFQILQKREDKIREIHRAIEKGRAFEELAAEQFPGLTASAGKHWDLGFLRWEQLPESWRPVVTAMKAGEVSDVVQEAGRFWIIQLIEVREDPSVTFESSRVTLSNALKRERVETLRAQTEKQLRDAARVVFLDKP